MTARTTIASQATALARDLQPLIDRHETFPEIYGEADGLADLQAVLWGIATAFEATRHMAEEPGEPF